MRRLLPNAAYFWLLILCLFAASCETTAPGGGGSQRSAETVARFKTTVVSRAGVKWEIPAQLGSFEQNQNYDRVFAAGRNCVSILYCVDLGELKPDESACVYALFRNFDIAYPAANILRQPDDEVNGIRWNHYISKNSGDRGSLRLNVDVAQIPGVLVGLISLTPTESGAEQSWGAEGMYKFISLVGKKDNAQPTWIERDSVRKNSGDILAYIGRSYLDRSRPEEAVAFIRAACAIRPDDQPLAEFYVDSLITAKKYEETVSEGAALLAKFPKSSGLVWRRAFALGELDKKDEALAQYNRAVSEMGDNSSPCLNAYLSYLCKIREIGKRLSEVEALAEKNGEPMVQLYLAKACVESGDGEKADKTIDEVVARYGENGQLAQSIVSLYSDAGQFEKAHRVARNIAATGNPEGDYLEAIVYFGENLFEKARESALKSLAKMPNDRNVLEIVDAINARLGKADTSLFRNPVEPVALPADFLVLKAEAPAGFEDGFGAYNQYRGVMYFFEPGKTMRTTRYGRICMTSVNAIRERNEITLPFDPLFERIFVNRLEVFDTSGAKIAEGELANYYVANSTDDTLMSQKKELHMPVPAMTPGCTVEYVVTYETLGPQDNMLFQICRLSGDVPTLLSFAGVRGATDKITVTTANGVEALPDTQSLVFRYAKNPEPTTQYSSMPPDTTYAPCVWVGIAGRTWADECAEYLKTVGDLYAPSEIAAEKVKQILGDNFTEEEAVRKITSFVRESLTYQGLLFGVRAMIPNKCETILSNRYGDCKDHSFLLMQMLRAAKVKAYLALVDTEKNVNISIPDTFQFNHMIVYLPEYRGGIFIDATDKELSERIEPLGLEGCPCLIIDAENPRIVNVPANPPGTSVIRIDRKVTVSEDGTALVSEKAVFTGLWAGYVRNVLRGKTPREYPVVLARGSRTDGLNPVRAVQAENLDDPDAEVTLTYEFAVKAFSLVEGKLVGRIPLTWDLEQVTLPGDQLVRRIPLSQDYLLNCETDVTVITPAGWKVDEASEGANAAFDTPSVAFSMTLLPPEGDFLRYKVAIERRKGLFPAAEAKAREEACDEARRSLSRPIILVKQ
jgi:tetratricopeptide (TPR) repeat protein